jgi:ribosomal protein S18 acetylase RimI-like enzyme
VRAAIRRAAPPDAELLARLNRHVHELHVASRPDHFRPTTVGELVEHFAAQLARTEVRAWIAERDGAAIGYALAVHRDRAAQAFLRARRWCEIDQIAVDPAHRRGGVGASLVEHVVADARASGLDDVQLTAWQFNESASRAFERMGFVSMLARLELRPTVPRRP